MPPVPEPRGQNRPGSKRRRPRSLANAEELFHLLIDNVRDYAIFVLDPAGRALTWNAGVKRMLGYGEEDFVGRDFCQLFRAHEQEAAARELENAAAAGRSDDERWHVRNDGTELWVTGVLTALRDPAGHLRGYVKIMRDATAQRQAALEREDLLHRELAAREQAERANRMKDEFLAIVSHELRTPLNAILGWARMLASDQLDAARAKRAIETIERNAKTQAELVEDLLDLSRIVTGKFELELQAVVLPQVIDAAVESLHYAAAAKQIRVATDLANDSAPVEGDARRLQQVVLNLLSNAIKFTPHGGTVEIALQGREDDVEFTVRDSGPGISLETLPTIFDRFHQTTSGGPPTTGLGLGLTIARHIVEAHKGSIEAHSDGAGNGATFTVRLPHAKGDSGASTRHAVADPRPPHIEQPPELNGRSALVVEDQPDSQDLAAFLLTHCGMRVLTAASVGEALVILDEHRVDIIVSDIGLGNDEDGIALIRHVRARPEPLGCVPAVAVSAHANSDDRARALAAGYGLHVAKPFEPSQLIGGIAALLRATSNESGSSSQSAE